MTTRALVSLLIVVGGAACGNIRLAEPTSTTVSLAGAHFTVEAREDGMGRRLAFHGYFYGYENRGGRTLIRHMDAGTVMVAGIVASRSDGPSGEAEYTLEVAPAAIPDRVLVTVGGSDEIASCSADIPLPVVRLGSGVIHLSSEHGLRVPLPSFASATGQRIDAMIRITGGHGTGAPTVVTLEKRVTEPELVIPASVLSTVPRGVGTLDIQLDGEYDMASSSACAPVVTVRAVTQVRRVARLE